MQSAVSQTITFPVFASDGSFYNSATVPTVTLSQTTGTSSGSTPASPTNTPARVGSTHLWSLLLTAAEATGSQLVVSVSGTSIRSDAFIYVLEQDFTTALAGVLDGMDNAAAVTLDSTFTAGFVKVRSGGSLKVLPKGAADSEANAVVITLADGESTAPLLVKKVYAGKDTSAQGMVVLQP